MVWVEPDQNGDFPEFSFGSLQQCFDFLTIHKDEEAYKQHYSDIYFMSFIQDSKYSLFEEKLDCVSFCFEPLFYISKAIELGMPEKDCYTQFQDKIGGEIMVVGAFLAIASLISFLMSCCKCCYCCKKDKLW